jgi:glycosyltransferase involved in cell wall biosynthesis
VRYLFFHSGTEWSGSARAFASVARGLVRRGHAVSFAVEPDSPVENTLADSAHASDQAPLEIETVSMRGTWLGVARRLARVARRRGADVILVQTDRDHLVASIACRLGARARVIRRVRAGRGDEIRRTGRIAARIAPTCYVFATEREAREVTVPHGAVGVAVAPLGVPEVPPQNAADLGGEFVDIVCVHDASSRSRAAAAIRAVAMLGPRHPGLRLVIIGEGIYDDDLRMQAAALGALERVTSLGDRTDQIDVMRTAKLGWVVASSDTAAYGVLDFMSLGIPVLAPDHTVARDYVLHDITGVLVAGDDAFVTAAAAAELLTNDGMREAMGAAARGRVLREGTEAAMIDGFERAADLAVHGRRR